MLQVSNVSRIISGKQILSDVSLTVNDGEILGLLGPNGAGKTTLSEIIASLDFPDSGSVSVNGKNLTESRSIRLQTGYLSEIPELYDHLTGKEFLFLTGGLYSIRGDELEKSIERYLNFFQLEPFADKRASGYPRGVRQKFALAAALLHQPQVLILDEPTSSLDPVSAGLVKILLSKLRSEKRSVLLTTHILEIAEILCDRIAIMNQGKLICCGTVEELRQLAKTQKPDLEEIFLTLTGNSEYESMIRYLRE